VTMGAGVVYVWRLRISTSLAANMQGAQDSPPPHWRHVENVEAPRA
jgi:hypothetical protein